MLFANVLGRTNQLTSYQDPRSAGQASRFPDSKPSKFCLRLHGQTSHNGRQHLSCQEKGAKSHLRLKFRHLIGFVDFDRFRRGLAVERFLQRCNNNILKSISCMWRRFKHAIVATFPKKNQVQDWYGESRIMIDAMLTTWNRLVGEKYPSLLMLIDFLWSVVF